MNNPKKDSMQKLQSALETDSMTAELKAYITRLQDKLAKVRSLGGNYGRIDFSPYLKNIASELSNETEPQPVVIETRNRPKRGKTTNAR